MSVFVWVMLGIAVWHFAVLVPDKFTGGIIGAFLAAVAGALIAGYLLPSPGVPVDNPPGLNKAIWPIPGAVIALALLYAHGPAARARRKARRADAPTASLAAVSGAGCGRVTSGGTHPPGGRGSARRAGGRRAGGVGGSACAGITQALVISTGRCVRRRSVQTPACHLGEPMWIAPTPVDRTAGIGQEELKLRDDGDIDGLQLTEAFGERAQRFLMLEHQLMSHHLVRRSTLLYCGEVEQCASAPPQSFVALHRNRVGRREPSGRRRSTGRPLARVPRRPDVVAGPRGSGRAASQPHLEAGRRSRRVLIRSSLRSVVYRACGATPGRPTWPRRTVARPTALRPQRRGAVPALRRALRARAAARSASSPRPLGTGR